MAYLIWISNKWYYYHFELTPHHTLQAAQQSLASELEPAISTLLQRAELYLAKQERKQESLRARSDLLEGRLEGNRDNGKKQELRKKRSVDKLVRSSGSGKRSEEKAFRYCTLLQFSAVVYVKDVTC
jgi:DASH complex subunit SPC19